MIFVEIKIEQWILTHKNGCVPVAVPERSVGGGRITKIVVLDKQKKEIHF